MLAQELSFRVRIWDDLWRRLRDWQLADVWDLIVERTLAWLNQFRRLRVRYDMRPDIHETFLSLSCALICWHSLQKTGRTA